MDRAAFGTRKLCFTLANVAIFDNELFAEAVNKAWAYCGGIFPVIGSGLTGVEGKFSSAKFDNFGGAAAISRFFCWYLINACVKALHICWAKFACSSDWKTPELYKKNFSYDFFENEKFHSKKCPTTQFVICSNFFSTPSWVSGISEFNENRSEFTGETTEGVGDSAQFA